MSSSECVRHTQTFLGQSSMEQCTLHTLAHAFYGFDGIFRFSAHGDVLCEESNSITSGDSGNNYNKFLPRKETQEDIPTMKHISKNKITCPCVYTTPMVHDDQSFWSFATNCMR
eukprot:338267-Amphidinium_carterae.1